MAEKKMFLLDAYALIFRAYYAFISRPIKNSKGMNTSAIFGFTNTLDEVIRKEKPTHIAVAFDPPSPTFRHEMYSDYKANRLETPDDIRLSVPYIKEIIGGYNIPILEVAGYEADDVIGTVARQAANNGFEVYMMTPDKDYLQLVSEHVYLYKPRRSGGEADILGVEEVKKEWDIEHPEQFIDILALWGDASDNVPGAPGIGEKTAKALINKYKSIEGLYENISELKGKQKENLLGFRDQIETARKLVTIVQNVPVEINYNDIELTSPNIPRLKELFSELEFRTFMNRLSASPQVPQAPVQGSLFDEVNVPGPLVTTDNGYSAINDIKHEYFLVDTPEKRKKLVNELQNQHAFCFDTETTGLDALNVELVGLSFSFRAREAFYVPFPAGQVEATSILSEFAGIFGNEKIRKTGQNLKYDLQVLSNYGIEVKGEIFDTMIAHYLIQPELPHNMDYLSRIYLRYNPVSIETLIGPKGKGQLNMRSVDLEIIKEYAGEDADITWQLSEILRVELEKLNMLKLAENIEMPLVQVLADMEKSGFKISTDDLNNYAYVLKNEITNLETEIHKLAGVTFNIASPKQLGEILFDRLKIASDAKRTKTKQYSTSEETLTQLKGKHSIIDKVLEYRTLVKLLNTYVEVLPKLVNQHTGKVHTSFEQAWVATGRLSSKNPNLQNIPIREERGREIRKSFIASDNDHILLSADYSQIELRLMAHMSGDRNMIEAFKNDEDIHAATAARIYNVAIEQVTREMRGKAKTANFGIIYGISAFGLSQRLNISRSEAKELIDGYFAAYGDVKNYMDKAIHLAKEKGYVETIMGRRRYLKEINSPNALIRGNAERNAINAPIQGSAADIIKQAMVNIHCRIKNNFRSRMILQVHDELIFDVYKPELETIKEIVKNEMEKAVELSVPLVVDIGIGNNWLDAH
ncbi:MAG: DNA polymerase I [Bacteroidales bacterium]|nr:DNA polymerase I [Bacteroidales bacterium]